MKVTTEGGSTWRISRRWLPWRRRMRFGSWVNGLLDLMGLGSAAGGRGMSTFNDLPGLLQALYLLFWVVVLIPLLLLSALMAGELAIAAILLPFVLAARFWFKTPWIVEVIGHRGHVHHEVPVAGWEESQVAVAELAERYRAVEDPRRPATATDEPDEDEPDEDEPVDEDETTQDERRGGATR